MKWTTPNRSTEDKRSDPKETDEGSTKMGDNEDVDMEEDSSSSSSQVEVVGVTQTNSD